MEVRLPTCSRGFKRRRKRSRRYPVEYAGWKPNLIPFWQVSRFDPYGSYYNAIYPGTFIDPSPTKTAKSTLLDKEDKVDSSMDGNANPGRISHYHIAAAGFPNLYTYVNQNPWTLFDPEGLDPIPTDHGTNTFVANPANFGAQTLQQLANNVRGQFVANPNPNYTGQCATGAQYLAGSRNNGQMHDVPSARTWTEGRGVNAQTRPGTVLAAGWDATGHYPNNSAGNHTVIFTGVDNHGNVQVLEQNVHTQTNPQGAYQTRTLTPEQARAFHEVESRQANGGRSSSQLSRTRDLTP